MRNSTTAAVVLRPCPGYSESLYASGLTVRRLFALNCVVERIPAHGHVRYAMQLTVPRRAAPEVAKLGWMLDTPTGPFAGGAVWVRVG